ncbi:diaminopimelate epimerase [Halalkalibacterium halodurans]|uniref:diaminopimelate epimerase n=1 Tax=Halalkalibacterium halodurans TaxID=86665 RepID=UPI001067FF53|nr:diaminopimelate epimerase [Halalkalibacterium halodurans]MED3645264.1 diaminopimelate epimerase [Halalkalibacterium halodurans]TES54292.1 diaminopimelate epimerase [Halalkalibacterium halodurans]
MKFTKMHGLGNSYIYVDCFKETLKEEELPALAVAVADKNKGIGSDGMILICPSDRAPVKMRVFNNDGSEAKNCGNGLRCVAKFAFEHGYVKETSFDVETLGGLVKATVHPNDNGLVDTVTVNMGEPRLRRAQIPMLGEEAAEVVAEPFTIGEREYRLTAVSMGNPHAILFVDTIEDAPVEQVGPLLEKHEAFPDWVNVEFVQVVSPTEIHFRVWERGSGITQACGTGACAAVVASVLNGFTQKGKEVIVHLLGGDLTISWLENGDVLMTGAAETICEGTYVKSLSY